MQGENGYFQLIAKQEGFYIRLIPPTGDGVRLEMGELTSYLDRHQIVGYDYKEMKKCIEELREEVFLLTSVSPHPCSEEMRLTITEDNMLAIARFYPPYAGGSKLDQNDIVNQLFSNGIKAGIQKEEIERFLNKRSYCTNYILARGKEVEQGSDAVITYYFNTDLDSKPVLKEDGTVDFHVLNNISHVKKGDLLAKLTKEVEGKPGKTIMGVDIAPRQVKREKLRFGRNITCSEDKLTIVSDVSGHVELADGKVFVSDVYEISADVDVSTGNIEYEGNIKVIGNVRTGYVLKASGDIVVDGIVEGAQLISGRDIVLKRGIQGMAKGILKAEGNIIARFIENAKVTSGGDISTEAILHSVVLAREKIRVTGKRGFVTGGKVEATLLVEAKTIGSNMGAETIIAVGTDPQVKERYRNMQAEIGKLRIEEEKLKPTVTKAGKLIGSGLKMDKENLLKLRTMMKSYQKLTEQIAQKFKELEDLEMYLDENNDARICVTGKIYPGVKIQISECRYIVKNVEQYCQYRKVDGEIRVSGL